MKQFTKCPECGFVIIADYIPNSGKLASVSTIGNCTIYFKCQHCGASGMTMEKEDIKAMQPLKALSLQQPWATLVVSGIKDIENRSWKLPEKYKGQTVLIQATAKDFDFSTALSSEYQREFIRDIKKPYIHSAIVGSVDIVDCIKSVDNPNKPWGNLYCWHWILAHAVKFNKPIPCKGQQRFFTPKIIL